MLFLRRGSPIEGYEGEIRKSSLAGAIKKGVATWDGHDRHHLAQAVYAQGKGMILIDFHFYRSHVVSWETGFRIGSRTIKRGSQMSNLIASTWELKPLHSWHHLFLVVIWILSLWSFRACVILMASSSSSNGFYTKILLRFESWRFYRFVPFSEVKPFILWFILRGWTMMFLCMKI